MRQGLSVNEGQALFTIVDSSRGFGVDASANSLIRRKLAAGQTAHAEFVNPADGRTVRIPVLVGAVGPIGLEDLDANAALNQRETANFSVTLRRCNESVSSSFSCCKSCMWVRSSKLCLVGPRTNLLTTFIRPLRLTFVQWLG